MAQTFAHLEKVVSDWILLSFVVGMPFFFSACIDSENRLEHVHVGLLPFFTFLPSLVQNHL